MTRRTGLFALATAVAVVYVAAACLQTESLGSDQSSVVSPCDRSACTGTPDWTLCKDGHWVGPTGRCVQIGAGVCGWEPGNCDQPDVGPDVEDAGRPLIPGDTSLMCMPGEETLKGEGPWDDARKCWIWSVHYFQCVPSNLGPPRTWCFLELDTGKFYRSGTMHVPSGPQYRTCTVEEVNLFGATYCD